MAIIIFSIFTQQTGDYMISLPANCAELRASPYDTWDINMPRNAASLMPDGERHAKPSALTPARYLSPRAGRDYTHSRLLVRRARAATLPAYLTARPLFIFILMRTRELRRGARSLKRGLLSWCFPARLLGAIAASCRHDLLPTRDCWYYAASVYARG